MSYGRIVKLVEDIVSLPITYIRIDDKVANHQMSII